MLVVRADVGARPRQRSAEVRLDVDAQSARAGLDDTAFPGKHGDRRAVGPGDPEGASRLRDAAVVVGVVAVRQVLDYSNTGRAIIVCLIAGVICWIVSVMILTPLIVGSYVVRSVTGF